MKKLIAGLAVALAFLTVAAAASAQAVDIIRMRSGAEVKGKVVGLTSSTVSYLDAAGKTQSAKGEDVASITFVDTPPSLPKANQAVVESKFDKAFTLFQESMNEIASKKSREFHKQYVLYDWAMAHQARGDIRQCLDTLQKIRKECGDCRLRADSFRKGLDIARKKAPDQVADILKEMKGEPEPVGGEAAMELARMHYDKGEFDQAVAEFNRLAANAGAPYAADAKLWGLRCLRGLKKFDELESSATRILGDRGSASPALVQCAGSGLAEILLNKAAKDKTKVRDALMASAQAIAVGPPPMKEDAEDYLIALLAASKCYQLMSNEVAKPETKTDYKNRAVSYAMEVSRMYKGTKYAITAQKELVALGVDEKAPKEAAPKEAPAPKK